MATHIKARIGVERFHQELTAAEVGEGVNVPGDGSGCYVMPGFDVAAVQAVVDAHDRTVPADPRQEYIEREDAIAKIDMELTRGSFDETEARKALTQARTLLAA